MRKYPLISSVAEFEEIAGADNGIMGYVLEL